MTLGIQFGSGPKYEQMSSAHPSDENADLNHPHEVGGATATSPQWPKEWDEDAHNASWGQHDMSGEPDIPVMKRSSYKPAPKWDDE